MVPNRAIDVLAIELTKRFGTHRFVLALYSVAKKRRLVWEFYQLLEGVFKEVEGESSKPEAKPDQAS